MESTPTTQNSINRFDGYVADIMAKLPQNPYIVDLVGRAIKIFIEYNLGNANVDGIADAYIANRLLTVSKVADYAAAVSTSAFFKHHLITASALVGVPEDLYKSMDNATNTLSNTIKIISDVLNNHTCKGRYQAVSKAQQTDIDYFTIVLIFLTDEVNAIMNNTGDDCTTNLMLNGYVEASVRTSNKQITNHMYPYYNAFLAALNKATF